MKLSKLILTTVAATFLLTSISADATVIIRDHRTFKGNGTPASEALAKKCQTIWDEYEEIDYQATVIKVEKKLNRNIGSAEEIKYKKIVADMREQTKTLWNQLNNNRCL